MKMDVHLPVSLGTADKHQSGLTTLPPYPSVQLSYLAQKKVYSNSCQENSYHFIYVERKTYPFTLASMKDEQ